MTRWLAWLAIAGLGTYLTFIGGAWLGIYAAPLRLMTMVAAAGVLGVWLVVAIRSPAWRPRSVLMPVILAALGSLAISTVFSRVPRVSLEYLGYAIVLAALYLLLVRLMADPFLGRRVRSLAPLFFAVIAGSFLILVVVHWIDWWALLGRFAIPPLRPNFEGLTYLNPSAVLTMTTLFGATAAALLAPGRHNGRAGLVAIGLTAAVVAFLTGSRAGWLAIALTMAVAAVVVLLDRGRRSTIREAVGRTLANGRARAIAAAVAIVIVVVAIAFTPAIVRRITEGGEEARVQLAASAIRIWTTSPIVGTGPGTWVVQRLATTDTDEPDTYIPHAHNLEVQTLAELGMVGIAAGLLLVVAIGRLVAGGFRDLDPLRQRFAWATFVGLAYFGLHHLLDFYANMPAALFAAALPLAYLDATAPARQPAVGTIGLLRRAMAGRAISMAVAAVLAVSIAGLLLQEAPALQAARAVQLADQGDWVAADRLARAAADTDADIGTYAFTAGLTAARANDHQAARAYFARVAERDDLPEAWLNLAAVQIELGLTTDARVSLDRAFRLGRQRPAVAMGVADFALRLGDGDLAASAAAAAITGNPTIAADPWWSSDADRATTLGSAVREVMAVEDADQRWPVALMLGDPRGAATIAASGERAEFASLVIEAWAGGGAVDFLFERCEASPLDAVGLIWCARVAAHRGDLAQANRMRMLLEVLSPGASNRGGVLRVAPTDDEPMAASGLHAINWGTFTYRRATPRDMLVPSVVHLILE